MSIPPYVKGFPQDGSSLGSTKAQIRANLDGTFEALGINHFDQNSLNPGKHQYVQMPTTDRPNTTGPNEILLYNGVAGGVNNLYYVGQNQTVSSSFVQMTTNLIPARTQRGYSWLPGGLLIQWGFDSITTPVGSASPINFPVNFVTVAGFAPIVTITPRGSVQPLGSVIVTSTSINQFVVTNYSFNVGSIYWHAIGPI